MTEEEKLEKAYHVLGLDPGDPLEKINRRHKRLIMVWHPDRFPTNDGKADAEEELKQINNAKDVLKKHFETAHKSTGACVCRPGKSAKSYNSSTSDPNNQKKSGQGPGPGRRRTQENDREEQEAARRSAERARKAAAEQAEKERQARTEQTAAQAAAASAQTAMEQNKQREDESLRWQVTVCLAVAWIGLSIFGFLGMTAKGWWHNVSFYWENHNPFQKKYVNDSNSSSNSNNSSPPGSSTNTNSQPYVPPYNQPPVSDTSTSTSQSDSSKLWKDPFSHIGPPPENNPQIQPAPSSPGIKPFSPPQSADTQATRKQMSDFLNEAPVQKFTTPHWTPQGSYPTVSPLDTGTQSQPGSAYPPFKPMFTPTPSDPATLRKEASDLINGSSKSNP